MNKVFVRTAKAEREGMKLSSNHLRMLSLIDGKTPSRDLARRAPPSLRNIWHEHLIELVKGGYIVDNPEDVIDRKIAQREINPIQKIQNTHTLQKPQAAVPTTTDPEAKQKAEKAARAAELKAYFATAKEKTKAEAKQRSEIAARARAELEAATAAAKASSDAKAKAKAGAKQRDEKAAHAQAELEAAVAASKIRSDALKNARTEAKRRDEEAASARVELETAKLAAKKISNSGAQARTAVSQDEAIGMPIANSDTGIELHNISVNSNRISPNEEARLHNLELENEALKKLLAEAYLEITMLKTSL